MRRFGWVALALVFFMLAGVPAARAEKRIALLIGNQGYSTEIAVSSPIRTMTWRCLRAH